MTINLQVPSLKPRSQLVGKTLVSGWTLVEKINSPPGSTGGNFGQGYRAEMGDKIAFVKAIDFVDALSASDPLSELSKLTAIANFEREVLAYCSESGMSKVLKYFGHEYVSCDGSADLLSRVSCLIMEAGTEDLRGYINVKGAGSCAWNLQVMCDVSQAIFQLHRGLIAHQDIKPSNVISVKGRAGQPEVMKVGDLGRVVRRNQAGPFDTQAWPGDRQYCPPERWYGYTPSDWCDARDSADAYMLGSLLIFLFTGATLQTLVKPHIPDSFKPNQWTGRYDDDLLPVLVDAHIKVLNESLLPCLLPEIADGVMDIAKNLTHPDPLKRGDKNSRKETGRPVGIDRVFQKMRMLSLRSAAIERGGRRA